MNNFKDIDFFELESAIWVANKTLNIPAYDFKFSPLFKTSRPRIENNVSVVSRIGAIQDYEKVYNMFYTYGFDLINTPLEHYLASELERWYPVIKHLTPKSKVYDKFPALEVFYNDFSFPVFIKGNRQTAKHNSDLSIAYNKDDFLRIQKAYVNDTILHWQKVVIRDFINLKPVDYTAVDKVPISFEFRSFWWKKELVGVGHYWFQYISYSWTDAEKSGAIEIAREAANLIDVPFIAIDLALTKDDEWIVIECNDAQESGYCGVKPIELWQNIISIEK